MIKTSISSEDSILFLEMTGWLGSPNYKQKLYRRLPYVKILKDFKSDERKKFISIYNDMKYLLLDKEIDILDRLYGVNNEKCSSLREIGEWLGVGPGRVRQIRNKAETKMCREIKRRLVKAEELE